MPRMPPGCNGDGAHGPGHADAAADAGARMRLACVSRRTGIRNKNKRRDPRMTSFVPRLDALDRRRS